MSNLQSLDGALRNLLRGTEFTLAERAQEYWDSLPEPKLERATGIAQRWGLNSTGRGVVRDLLYLMLAEQAEFRRNILRDHGDCYEQREPGMGMFIDHQEQMAEYLASARAIARLALEEPPKDWRGFHQPWMDLARQ